jgi:hypothetical protein
LFCFIRIIMNETVCIRSDLLRRKKIIMPGQGQSCCNRYYLARSSASSLPNEVVKSFSPKKEKK